MKHRFIFSGWQALKVVMMVAFVPTLTISLHSQTLTDVMGNVYSTVIIGDQEWMSENLRTSLYDDGTPIDLIISNQDWTNATSGAYCWYNNDSATHNIPYGILYNGYAALNPNICPQGWSIPGADDWVILATSLGGYSVAGSKMKHAGTQYWNHPNTGATNSSEWSGMPGGWRSNIDGGFGFMGDRGGWFAINRTGDLEFFFLTQIESLGKGFVQPSIGISIRCFRSLTGIEETSSEQNFKIVPNPSQGVFRIISQNSPHEFIIFDIAGKQLMNGVFFGEKYIDISSFQNGTYIIMVSNQQGHRFTEKIVLIR